MRGRRFERLAGRERVDWLLLASLVALALNTHGEVPDLGLYLGLVAIVFVFPAAGRRWWLWAAIASIQGARHLLAWEGVDDHIILGTYWAVAVAIGLWTGRPERVLALSGRMLIGLVFLFAAGWKVLSPAFRDGSFFTLYLTADPRFLPVAETLGGLDESMAMANRLAIASLYDQPSVSVVTLHIGRNIPLVAGFMSWWGIALESALAATWLMPLTGRWEPLRHVLLVVFVATTYGLVAITGFGAILLVMAMAVSDRRWFRAHGVVFVLLMIWTPIWRLLVL